MRRATALICVLALFGCDAGGDRPARDGGTSMSDGGSGPIVSGCDASVDSDGDGIADDLEGTEDLDGDGQPEHHDYGEDFGTATEPVTPGAKGFGLGCATVPAPAFGAGLFGLFGLLLVRRKR